MKKALIIAASCILLSVVVWQVWFAPGSRSEIRNTQFSEGYSDTAYEKITEDMRQREVLDLMGEPLRVVEGVNGLSFYYSEAKDHIGDYIQVAIHFNEFARVVSKDNDVSE